MSTAEVANEDVHALAEQFFHSCTSTDETRTIFNGKSDWNRKYEDLHLAIHQVLNLNTLKPCPATNAAFTSLVHAIINYQGTGSIYKIIEQGLVNRVREVAGLAEAELETMWALKIINSLTPDETLGQFPYYINYEKLVSREIELLVQSGLNAHRRGTNQTFRVLFVGCGPLAMTSIILHKILPHAYVENVDICMKAIGLSERVGNALRLGTRSGFCIGDGATVQISTKYDLILIAALAGTTQQKKQAIIDNLKSAVAPGGRVLLRSAIGARELLYPVVQLNKLNGVQALVEYHPDDDVINSVIVCSLN